MGASLALKRRLAAQWPAPAPAGRTRWPSWSRWLMPAAAVLLLLVIAVPAYQGRREAGMATVASEAINDHLRVLQPDRPLGVANTGMHEV